MTMAAVRTDPQNVHTVAPGVRSRASHCESPDTLGMPADVDLRFAGYLADRTVLDLCSEVQLWVAAVDVHLGDNSDLR